MRVRRGRLRENADLDDSEPPLNGVCDEEASLGPDQFVLLDHKSGHFSQTFLVVGLGAEVDDEEKFGSSQIINCFFLTWGVFFKQFHTF